MKRIKALWILAAFVAIVLHAMAQTPHPVPAPGNIKLADLHQ
jgi:hypothetical protein